MNRTALQLAALALLETTSAAFAQPWYARGAFYSAANELGQPGLWGADSGNEVRDDGIGGDAVASDGIFSRLITTAVGPGRYEFKIGNLDWSDDAPTGFNINCVIETFVANDQVLVTFDTNTYLDGRIPQTRMVWSDRLVQPLQGWYVVGDIPELGAWDPMLGVLAYPTGTGLFSATVYIGAAGPAQYKWTADRQWIYQEVGGQGFSIRDTNHNVPMLATAPGFYEFLMDPSAGRVFVRPGGPTAVEATSWGRVKALYRAR